MLLGAMQTSPQHGRRRCLFAATRIARVVSASMLLFALSSCFTMVLWGFEPDSIHDPETGKEKTAFSYDEDTEWSWPLFFGRVLTTPFALCLDCLTAPVQIWLFDYDDGGTMQAR
jgi:hypothetical protein